MAIMFAPVIYVLGGVALRATTAAIARRLAAAGAKKIAEKTAKNVVNATKNNISKAVKLAKAPKTSTTTPKIKQGGKNPRDRAGKYTGYKPPATTPKPSALTTKPRKDSLPSVGGPKATATKRRLNNAGNVRNTAILMLGTSVASSNVDNPVVPKKTTVQVTPVTRTGPPQRKGTKPSGSFGEAFKKAYNKGKGRGKTFTYNGDKFIAITKDDLKDMGGKDYSLSDYKKDASRKAGKKTKN